MNRLLTHYEITTLDAGSIESVIYEPGGLLRSGHWRLAMRSGDILYAESTSDINTWCQQLRKSISARSAPVVVPRR